MKITIEDKKVKTGRCRISYPKLVEAKSYKGGAAKFGATFLVDKDEDLSKLKAAVHAAKVEKWGEDPKKWPTKRLRSGKVVSALKSPFRDGDREKPDQKEYRGKIFFGATAKERPGIVDKDRENIDPKEVYAGCFVRAELIAFAYDNAGNMGVSFALMNLQKMGEGPRLSGKKDAKDVFDAVEDASDDEENYEPDGDSEEDSDEDDLGF